jgi:hypothetical protein
VLAGYRDHFSGQVTGVVAGQERDGVGVEPAGRTFAETHRRTCQPHVCAPGAAGPTALDVATAQDRSTRSSGARCAFLSRARSPAPGPTTERRNRGRHRARSRKVAASRSLLRSRGFKFRPPRAGQRVPARNTALIVKRRYYHARVRDHRGHFISPQADTGVRIPMRGGP